MLQSMGRKESDTTEQLNKATKTIAGSGQKALSLSANTDGDAFWRNVHTHTKAF